MTSVQLVTLHILLVFILVIFDSIGQFHVTTDTTQKNKSSYSEYLVIVLYSTHITCHGFKGNIQI